MILKFKYTNVKRNITNSKTKLELLSVFNSSLVSGKKILLKVIEDRLCSLHAYLKLWNH